MKVISRNTAATMIANTASLEVFLLRTSGASGVLGVLGVPGAMGMTPGVCGGTVFPAGWTGMG